MNNKLKGEQVKYIEESLKEYLTTRFKQFIGMSRTVKNKLITVMNKDIIEFITKVIACDTVEELEKLKEE